MREVDTLTHNFRPMSIMAVKTLRNNSVWQEHVSEVLVWWQTRKQTEQPMLEANQPSDPAHGIPPLPARPLTLATPPSSKAVTTGWGARFKPMSLRRIFHAGTLTGKVVLEGGCQTEKVKRGKNKTLWVKTCLDF